jgi:hypothetical protein
MAQLFRTCVLVGALAIASCGPVVQTSGCKCDPESIPRDGGGGGDGGASSSSSGQSSSSSGPPEKPCEALASAICAKRDACDPFNLKKTFGDRPTCEQRFVVSCEDALELTDSSTTSENYQSCAKALGSVSCDDFLMGNRPAACRAGAGPRKNGTKCGDDAQCQTAFCKKQGECGVCTTKSKPGESCSQNSDCEDGYMCSGQNKCAPPRKAGDPCGTAAPCLPTLGCSGDTDGGTGTCSPLLDAGSVCQTEFQCNALMGIFCNYATPACAEVELRAPGLPCGKLNGSDVECRAGGQCKTDPSTMLGTCVGPAKDGAACDLTQGRGCLEPAQCVNLFCTLPSPSTCK